MHLRARVLWAKKSVCEAGYLWLPLHSHMADAAQTARNLWQKWLPEGTKKCIRAYIKTNLEIPDFSDENLLAFLAAAHDLGKATPVFQSKQNPLTRDLDQYLHKTIRESGLPLAPNTRYDGRLDTHHSIASHAILRRHNFDESIAVVLGAHHGKPPGYDRLNLLEAFGESCGFDNGNWQKTQEILLDHALKLAEIEKPLAASFSLEKPAQVLLSALVIMADWISSDERLFPLIPLEEYNTDSQYRAERAWKELNLTRCWSTDRDWEDLYKRRFGLLNPRPIQEHLLHISRECLNPGIVVVEAPMGEGKTEAALAAAEIMAGNTERGGLFFALPTQATSNAMLVRVCRWAERLGGFGDTHSILLAHDKADFNETYQRIRLSEFTHVDEFEGGEGDSLIVHEWLRGRKKGILSDFVIGTVDHVLMAGLRQKHVMLRHLGLANKVVIIDECHAYDAYMSQYLQIVLKWLGSYSVPVIVLSATLPSETRRSLIEAYVSHREAYAPAPTIHEEPTETAAPEWATSREYPLITYTDGKKVIQKAVAGQSRQIEIEVRRLSDDSLMVALEDVLSNGGCIGIIVNTVRRAQQWHQTLADRFGNEYVKLLHSRFISCDRARKEGEIQELLGPPETSKRPDKIIVVGTQVLEQSLDIDFDLLVTDICPMDLLLQRMGRLHRHDRCRPVMMRSAKCMVLGIQEEAFESGAEAIYGNYLLMRTKELLPERVCLPGDIASLVQDTYGGYEVSTLMYVANYERAKDEQENRIALKKGRARQFQISDPIHGWSTIVGWLDTSISDSTGKRAEATVRDAADSIEVIVIQKLGNSLRFLPWVKCVPGQKLRRDQTPDEHVARCIAGCSVRLPSVLSAVWNVDKAIAALETVTRDEGLDWWQKSPWLKGELFLVLDENFEANLCGYTLQYDRDLGLIFKKMEA